ncbi:hypothetical protein GO986_04185 [Deinococcus sp. HMF7620]|uniref:Uncharacterized protein n=1 Tax=Deinococcus arboris TaxID=2682977 RepID=A0A7C9LJJ7_9DEIO|nr:hypothetical protein [Deinococcus arboris]MVN85958.1 hypothetical protein [Deinococcus arboris]
MTPDEWTAGMENEAASVGDPRWSQETRQAARLRPRPLVQQVLVYGSFLVALGFLNTLLMDSALRFSVLQQHNTLGRWAINTLHYPGLIDLTHLLLPALFVAALATLRFSPLTLLTMSALSFLPMEGGAWLYAQTHDPLSYQTQSGIERINLVSYTGITAPAFILWNTALIGLAAYLGRGFRLMLTRRAP